MLRKLRVDDYGRIMLPDEANLIPGDQVEFQELPTGQFELIPIRHQVPISEDELVKYRRIFFGK